MVGFIELHFLVGDKEPAATPTPFLLAVESIVSVAPSGDCAYVIFVAGAKSHVRDVQESYGEVVAILQAFQRQWAAAAAPKKPLVRTHKRPQDKS